MSVVDLSNPHKSEQARLETAALRGWLARKRWVKCCSAVRATLRIVKMREGGGDGEGGGGGGGKVQGGHSYLSSDRELWLRSSMLISATYGRWRIAYL